MTTPKAKFAGLALIAALCAGFTFGLTAPAWAGWDEGVAAAKRADYATGVHELRPLAEQGYAIAQLVSRSLDVYILDDAEAVKPYRKAAEQGDADAQNNLGVIYSVGGAVPQDYAAAVQWYRKAAEQGHADAQNNLGAMYYQGEGVTQDYAEAVKWWRKAAEQGYAIAQNNLGTMYRHGYGVAQDFVLAHMWYNLAAAQGDKTSPGDRRIITREMTPAQISEAQKLAREWRPKKFWWQFWR